VDCIPKHPDHEESQEQLLQKYQGLMALVKTKP
jgi:hypothetical protein